MQHSTLQVEGMSCGHCVSSVQKALDAVEGVTVKNVSVGSAAVDYDESVVSPAQIASAVTKAGYAARVAA